MNILSFFKFTTDQIVKRLGWVLVAAILFSVINTLSGQPESFWHHPDTAIRGDGLSIYNTTNHTFEFFLGLGWQAYLITIIIYIAGLFLLVSILPRKAALIAIFSFIFGHFYGATNWLAVRWHLGSNASAIYGLVLAPILAFSAFPTIGSNTFQVIKGLRGVMLGPMVFYLINTLIGQPASYWLNPQTVHEGNQIARYFLIHGWYAYFFMQVILFMGLFWLVSNVPKRWSLICIFCFMFNCFIGASNWFFYEWRMGMETPVIFGIIVIILILVLAFPTREKANSKDFLSKEPVS